MSVNATPKQLEIARFLRDFARQHGCNPSTHEIAAHVGRDKVTVWEHLQALVRKGIVTQGRNGRNCARSYSYNAASGALAERTIDEQAQAIVDRLFTCERGAPVSLLIRADGTGRRGHWSRDQVRSILIDELGGAV